jgi:hypothetical protein
MTALASVFAAMLGCQSGSDGDALGGCSDYASAYCAKLVACSPLELRLTFGDEATCVRRAALVCAPFADQPGTSWTPAKLGACARSIAAASCVEAMTRVTADCAATPGTLSNGAACSQSTQCASSYCSSGAAPPSEDGGVPCGTCEVSRVPPVIGCGDAGACVSPEMCLPDGTGGVGCRRLPEEGEPCLASGGCDFGLTCIASVCSRPKGAGASCTELTECDVSKSLLCISSTCQMPTWVEPGSPCHTPDRLCSGGKCMADGFDPNSPATCMAWAADGSPCDPIQGSPCLDPAICLAGKCQLLHADCR